MLRAPSSYTQEEILQAVLRSVEATDTNRLSPLPMVLMANFREKHTDGNPHDHVPAKAGRNYRFLPVKQELLRTYGLATHWSCSHNDYSSAVAYGYVPSPKKKLSELDPSPKLWAQNGEHPPLAEASRPPITAAALAKRRENKRLEKAEKGKSETKFREIDLWPVVVRENIMPTPEAPERLMRWAKRGGGLKMVEFLFHRWDHLPSLISRCWKVEKVEEYLEQHDKARMDLLREALGKPCVCGGGWMENALNLFARNNINPKDWTDAVVKSLEHGRAKGTLVCHAGLHGNEGKSFMFGPLPIVFGEDSVFTLTSKSAFPLMNLERCRLTLLDDWRFNEDLVGYPLQLLWFEGKPIIIARPQNQHVGHLKYNKNDPVFITTLESDITKLEGKKLQEGDIDMMLRRLHIFRFHAQLEAPVEVPPCGRCFATLLLGGAADSSDSGSARKRNAHPGFTGETPESKRNPTTWTVPDVLQYLDSIGLAHVKEAFEKNAVDGEMLVELSVEDLQTELGLTKLQAKKVKGRVG